MVKCKAIHKASESKNQGSGCPFPSIQPPLTFFEVRKRIFPSLVRHRNHARAISMPESALARASFSRRQQRRLLRSLASPNEAQKVAADQLPTEKRSGRRSGFVIVAAAPRRRLLTSDLNNVKWFYCRVLPPS